MAWSPEARRRVLGVVMLLAAGAMLATGLTVLAPRLRGLAYILYWLGCMAFTFLAALTALLDLWATRRRIRQAQEELVSRAVDDLSRARRPANSPGNPSPTSGLSKPAANASIAPVSGRRARSP